MAVVATILADLDTSPIGTRSRLADEIGGVTVLRRTVERVRLAKRIEAVYVFCPPEQTARCSGMLLGMGAYIKANDMAPASWQLLARSARKWSLDGWRGGIGGTTCFDEYTDCRVLSALVKETGAKHVLSVPPAAPLLHPATADAMIRHHETAEHAMGVTFSQAPPGIAGVVLEAGFLQELAEMNIPLGWAFAYQPDNPRKDLVFQPCCVEIPAVLRHSSGRLIADTDRSFKTVTDILRGERHGVSVVEPAATRHADHDVDEKRTPSESGAAACDPEQGPSPAPEEMDLAAIGAWLSALESTPTQRLPREVEIELTTDDPYPNSLLRPRGSRVPRRGPIDSSVVAGVAAEMSSFDDALIVLGGFGDPLRHSRLAEILQTIRSAPPSGRRVYGLAVRSSAVDLTDEVIEALIVHEVDVINVMLDALTPELYGRLQSPDDPAAAKLENVLSGLNLVGQLRAKHKAVKPIILPEITKCRDNIHEMDEFYDGWIRRIGAATITGHSHYAGQCEDRSVIRMAPAKRCACRRIQSRCLVLADASVVLCDQDYKGLHPAGSLHEQSLEEIWQGAAFERVRRAHYGGQFDPTPLCAACDEWHRP
ncbi:MAG: SPASM domain-containing protein [Phycisphaerae bacterium]